jgi:hypothetical protein
MVERYRPLMRLTRQVFVVLTVTLFAVANAVAHHTVASSFDINTVVPLKGIITAVIWQNPHVIYRLAMPGADGVSVDWEIESRHLQGMRRDGIERDTIKVGDPVTVNALPARDGSRRAATASIILSDGRTVRVCTVTNGRCP